MEEGAKQQGWQCGLSILELWTEETEFLDLLATQPSPLG